MSEQFNVTVNLTTEVCCSCGVVFTLPCDLRERVKKNGNSFSCPNGHKMSYDEDTREEELEDENIELREDKRKLEARLKYYKGKTKKTKK